MSEKYSDQIAYRAAHYVDSFGSRDASPSKAARFAAIRYLYLMQEFRVKLVKRFTEIELITLKRIAREVDWSNADNFETFWARVYKVDSVLGEQIRDCSIVFVDALVDWIREEDNENHGQAYRPGNCTLSG